MKLLFENNTACRKILFFYFFRELKKIYTDELSFFKKFKFQIFNPFLMKNKAEIFEITFFNKFKKKKFKKQKIK